MTRHLRRLIAIDGPLPVSRYMAEVLGHPQYGYYMRQDPLGRTGDFITAPEVSQMFGELIGLWCADCWLQMGAPSKTVLLELGPGRGTLMQDLLRAARAVPDFAASIDIHLLEISPALRELQRDRLQEFNICWHDHLDSLPAGPMLCVGNEFFDALPVRQFERGTQGWYERLIDAGDNSLEMVLSREPTPLVAIPPALIDAPAGSTVEIAPAREATMQHLATHLVEHGGAALIIDYGYARHGAGDTLQAVKHHKPHDILSEPGTADITAHVNFQALVEAANRTGAAAYGPVDQGRFLSALGISERTDALVARAPDRTDDLCAAKQRLTAGDEMGALFKALAVCHPDLGMPSGFEAAT